MSIERLTKVYDVTLKRSSRNAAKNGYIRPTLSEKFMTDHDFVEILDEVSRVYISQNAVNVDYTITVPYNEVSARAIAWDGTNIIMGGYASDTIFIHDGLTSSVKYTIPAPAGSLYSLAYNKSTGDLLATDNNSDDLYVLDITNGDIKTQFELPSDDTQAICVDDNDNLMWMGKSTAGLVKVYSGISNTIIRQFNLTGISGYVGDITFDGKHLIVVSRGSHTVYVYDFNTTELMFSFNHPDGTYIGIAWATDRLLSVDTNTDLIYIRQN